MDPEHQEEPLDLSIGDKDKYSISEAEDKENNYYENREKRRWLERKKSRQLKRLTKKHPIGVKVKALKMFLEGLNKMTIAREVAVPESTLRGWIKQAQTGRFIQELVTELQN